MASSLPDNADNFWFLKFTLSRYPGLFLLELLNGASMFKATDPRDRIFALVGLASHQDPAFIKLFANYDKSVYDVHRARDVVPGAVAAENGLDAIFVRRRLGRL